MLVNVQCQKFEFNINKVMFKEHMSLSNAICNTLQDISIQIYVCHDLDLSGSRDVTGHVAI